jgi:carbon monoxide dehydrogenase subunit G
MIINQTFTVNAPQDRTAEYFFDIEQVTSCIPGVEGVQEVEPGRYEATLGVRLGPIRAAFKGSITLDGSEAPKRLRAEGEGRDRATGSSARVTFTADLSEDSPGVTTVQAVADVAIRGKLSQFGTGVMRAAAGEIVQEFATCANAKLAATACRVESAQVAGQPVAAAQAGPVSQSIGDQRAPATAAPRKQRGMASLVLRGLVRSLARGLRRAADRIEAHLDGTRAYR